MMWSQHSVSQAHDVTTSSFQSGREPSPPAEGMKGSSRSSSIRYRKTARTRLQVAWQLSTPAFWERGGRESAILKILHCPNYVKCTCPASYNLETSLWGPKEASSAARKRGALPTAGGTASNPQRAELGWIKWLSFGGSLLLILVLGDSGGDCRWISHFKSNYFWKITLLTIFMVSKKRSGKHWRKPGP